MKYIYTIRINSEMFSDLVWYNVEEKNLYDILKYIIEYFIIDGEM